MYDTSNTKLKTIFNLLLNHGYNPNDIQNFINADLSPYESTYTAHPLIEYARNRNALQDTFQYSPTYNRNLVEDLQNVQNYAIEEEAASWDRIPWNKPSSTENLVTKYGYDPYLLYDSLYRPDSVYDMEHGQAVVSEATGGYLGKPASVPQFSFRHEPAKQSAETLMNLTPQQMFWMDDSTKIHYPDDYLLYLIRDLAKGGAK